MRWHWWQPGVPGTGGCACSEAKPAAGLGGQAWGNGMRHLVCLLLFFIISSLSEYLKSLVAGDPLAQRGHREDAVVHILHVAASAGLELGLSASGVVEAGVPGESRLASCPPHRPEARSCPVSAGVWICGLLELFPLILVLSLAPTALPIQLFRLHSRQAARTRNGDFSGPVKGFE